MRGWRPIVALWVVAIAVAAVVAMRHVSHAAAAPPASTPRVGAELPHLAADTLEGSLVRIRGLRGHPVWINFFASWCPPCNAEMPKIVERSKLLRTRGLIVLGLDQQENPALVRRFMALYGIRFPVFIDPGSIAQRFGVTGLPVSVFVDRGGTIRAIRYGELDASTMDGDLVAIVGS